MSGVLLEGDDIIAAFDALTCSTESCMCVDLDKESVDKLLARLLEAMPESERPSREPIRKVKKP